MQKKIIKTVEDDAWFCDYCGERLTEANPRSSIKTMCNIQGAILAECGDIGTKDDLCATCAQRFYGILKGTLKTLRESNKKDNL